MPLVWFALGAMAMVVGRGCWTMLWRWYTTWQDEYITLTDERLRMNIDTKKKDYL